MLEELARNLKHLPTEATATWVRLRRQLTIEDNVLTLDRPTILASAKDRPILFSAVAWSDVLLTLDTKDFGELLGSEFYELSILRPGTFLEREREMNRLQ